MMALLRRLREPPDRRIPVLADPGHGDEDPAGIDLAGSPLRFRRAELRGPHHEPDRFLRIGAEVQGGEREHRSNVLLVDRATVPVGGSGVVNRYTSHSALENEPVAVLRIRVSRLGGGRQRVDRRGQGRPLAREASARREVEEDRPNHAPR